MEGKSIPDEDAVLGISKRKEEKEIEGISLDNFSQAISTPRSNRTSQSYLNLSRDLAQIDDSGDYLSEDNIKNAIKLAYRLYELDGVVANTVDTYVEFGVSDFKFHGVKNDKLELLLNSFKRNVNKNNPLIDRGLVQVGTFIALQYYLAGNIFPEPKWNKETLRLGVARPKQYETISSIHFYDPQNISIDDSSANTPVLVGVNSELQQAINLVKRYGKTKLRQMLAKRDLSSSGAINQRVLKVALELPNSVIHSLRNKNGRNYIELDSISVLQRKKAPWNVWGTPYVARAFKSIAIKHRLHALDMDTIDGLINLITIFKIGDKDRPATTDRLNAFASLMSNPSRSKFMVWAHDVETESIGAEGKVIEMTERYKQIDAQILEDLGLPSAFTRAGNSSAGDPWVQIVRLMERITRHRKTISLLFEDWATEIAERNNFVEGKDYENISVVWKRNNIMNPADIREFVVQLYDRGLITKTTAIYQTDGDIEKEISHRLFELGYSQTVDGESMNIDELLAPPKLPFSKNEKVQTETLETNRRPSKNDVVKQKE